MTQSPNQSDRSVRCNIRRCLAVSFLLCYNHSGRDSFLCCSYLGHTHTHTHISCRPFLVRRYFVPLFILLHLQLSYFVWVTRTTRRCRCYCHCWCYWPACKGNLCCAANALQHLMQCCLMKISKIRKNFKRKIALKAKCPHSPKMV